MSVENIINNLKDGDNVNANKEFANTMATKLTDALDAKKIELASSMVDRKKEEQEQFKGLHMKLITEYVENDLEVIAEQKGRNGEKTFTIEGVFMQANKKNRNGRIYEKKIMEDAVDKYVTEQVQTGRAVGELNHPEGPTVNLDKVSHKITSLKWEGNDVVGKASILKTPMGKIVEGLLEGGVKLGVSSRGMGTLENRRDGAYVRDDFMLASVDIVQDPSAPSAFVNGIMEGVDWIWDNGILKPQEIELIETEIKRAPAKALPELEIKAFKNFLSRL